MVIDDVERVVNAFNDCITDRDLDGLGELMSDDHLFADTGGNTWLGRAACVAAWSDFFAAFPDYRNVFDRVLVHGDLAIAIGESISPHPMLSGPAIWVVRVNKERVAEWRVYEDTQPTRLQLGID